MKKILILIFIVSLFLTGCFARPSAAPETEKIKVYTSFYPLYDFALKIGGERVEVINLIPAGIEPHDWEPGPQLLMAVINADILIFNGLGLEPWVEKTSAALKEGNLMLVDASLGIEPLRGYFHDHDDEDHDDEDHEDEDEDHDAVPDPHVWLDPMLALHQAENILSALITVDPASEEFYRENFNSFREQISGLDKAFAAGLKDIARREFVVTHLSFAYLARSYGLVQLGISGLSPYEEPGPGKMKEIVNFLREHNLKYIFREPLASPRLAEVLAAETGAEILTLNPLEGLSAEELAAGKDYIAVMYENLEQLKKALTE
jgi:zinc transport system substrate-binding protein